MRRFLPRAKDRRKVPIPVELRDSLREVFELIQEAKRNPDIRIDYDDAIQTGAVCGGRIGVKPRSYVLTYYPKGDSDRGRWFLTLDRAEIEDIGDGRMSEIALFCCTSPECRCKFRETNDHCFYCDYVDDPNYGTFTFPEAASKLAARGAGVFSENATKEDVISVLGAPDESGGGMKHPSLGYIGPWISYRRPDCRLRFEFNKNSTRIREVTIMDKNWDLGK